MIGVSASLRNSLRELYVKLFYKKNYSQIASLLKPGVTRVKAKIANGTEYTGTVYYSAYDCDWVLACEGTNGAVLMGYPLKEMYDIRVFLSYKE